MQSIDLSQISELDRVLENILNIVPEKRREMHEKIAEAIKEEVDTQIAQSGLNDSSGRVKDWQQQKVGSGGGYAAVRASDKAIGDNSPGAITNYLENGHKIREPSGKSPNYRPRIKKPYVDGFRFYGKARAGAEAKAISIAEEYVNDIAEKLEG
jgi:hypothetical protein